MLTLDTIRFSRGGFTLSADFSLADGARAAVIGPSGGGKSTLLSLIAGFDAPDAGRILWQGRDIGGLAPGDRPVAMLFQDGNLFPHLDIETNVALGVSPTARPGPEARRMAAGALAETGLAGFGNRKPGALSGGQQSRAALARTLLTARPVVLLDEPFAALGPAMRRDMLALVDRLLPEATILMVTHDVADAQAFAPTTIFVADGRVSPPRDTAALFADPDPDLAAYLA